MFNYSLIIERLACLTCRFTKAMVTQGLQGSFGRWADGNYFLVVIHSMYVGMYVSRCTPYIHSIQMFLVDHNDCPCRSARVTHAHVCIPGPLQVAEQSPPVCPHREFLSLDCGILPAAQMINSIHFPFYDNHLFP